MDNHLFISYAREDQSYARKLAEHLHQRGFDVWMDDRIDFGDDWWDTIVENLRASVGLVVVMTPESQKSKWVRRELLLALRWAKHIFPLLLRGEGFPLLVDMQHADVTEGRMPSDDFCDHLCQVLCAQQGPQGALLGSVMQEKQFERTLLDLRGGFVLPGLTEQGLERRLGYGMIQEITMLDQKHALVVAKGGARLFDLDTERFVWEMDCPTRCGALSPDGRLLALGGEKCIYVWGVDGRLVRRLLGHTGQVGSVTFAPDGSLLASGAEDKTVRLWRVADGALLHTMAGHTKMVWSLAFAPDGGILASGAEDKTVRVWRVSDGALLQMMEGHTKAVWSVAFAPDGRTLASGGKDRTVRLWRAQTGVPLCTLPGHKGVVTSLAFARDGTMLASLANDGMVWLWRISKAKLLEEKQLLLAKWNLASMLRTWTLGPQIDADTLHLWATVDKALSRASLDDDPEYVCSVAFAPDGRTLALGAGDKTIRLWRVSDGTLLHTMEGHTEPVWSLAFTPDGRTLASGAEDKTVRVWRVSDGALLQMMEGHTKAVWSVAFAPDGRTLASGGEDRTVRVWRVSDGTLLHTMEGHTKGVTSVAFAPDGRTLASGAEDSMVRVWRVLGGVDELVETHSVLKRLDGMIGARSLLDKALSWVLQGHAEPVCCVAFEPHGLLLASGGQDATVRLWRVSARAEERVLEGHTWPVWSVAFGPHGARLASGSSDDTVRLWRVSDGKLLQILRGHVDAVSGVAFSPNGELLASGSMDGTVRLWHVA